MTDRKRVAGAVLAAALAISGASAPALAANPCASQAATPEVDAKLVLRPKGTSLAKGDPAALVKQGEALFKDETLSTNGQACQSCHAGLGAFAPSFAKPYPHAVHMAVAKGGVTAVHLDEMVQFCMVVPMEAKPLPWDSKELAALTAYTGELQKMFQKAAAAGPGVGKTR